MPKLEKMRGKDGTVGKADPQTTGNLEGLIQDTVSKGCHFSGTHFNIKIRRSCAAIIDEHEDEIALEFFRWATSAVAVEWTTRICHDIVKACPAGMPMRDASEEALMRDPEMTFKSERPPSPKVTWPVTYTVASTFAEVVTQPKDILMHFAFPQSEFDKVAGPIYDDVGKLLHGSDTLEVARVNNELNDVPPPWGLHIDRAAILMYAAESAEKHTPAVLEVDLARGLTVYEIMLFMYKGASQPESRKRIAEVMNTTDPGLLHRGRDGDREL